MRSTGALQSIGITVDNGRPHITISTWNGNIQYYYRIDDDSEIYISGRLLEFQGGFGHCDTIRDLYDILKRNDVYKDLVFEVGWDKLEGSSSTTGISRCYNYCKKCQFAISDELLGDYFVKIPYDRVIIARKLWINSSPYNRYDYPAMKHYLKSLHRRVCGYLDTDIIEMAREQWSIENPVQTAYVFGPNYPAINKVIFNPPATIVMWSDGDKTIVKCQEGDEFDPEKGLAMACMKKLLGTNKTGSNYLEVVKGYISEFEAKEKEMARKEAQKSKNPQKKKE